MQLSRFNDTDKSILIYSVNDADNVEYRHDTGATVHGAGNDIKNLRFLYTVAYKMNHLGGDSIDWNVAAEAAKSDFRSQGIGEIDNNILSDINTRMKGLYANGITNHYKCF